MLLKVKFCFHRNQIWPLKYQILKMALPHGMSPSFWMHEPKWVILVSYYWKKKFLLNESNNYLLISFIALILRIIAVPFFLGHPVYIYIERERERERETVWNCHVFKIWYSMYRYSIIYKHMYPARSCKNISSQKLQGYGNDAISGKREFQNNNKSVRPRVPFGIPVPHNLRW